MMTVDPELAADLRHHRRCRLEMRDDDVGARGSERPDRRHKARVVRCPQRRAGEADAGDVDGVAFEEVDTMLLRCELRGIAFLCDRLRSRPPFMIAGNEDGGLAG